MIKDITEFNDEATLRGAVCVVGTGLAGMEAIRYLARQGLTVVVAEGGREAFDPKAQALNHVRSIGKPLIEPDPGLSITPYLPPFLRGESRLRQLGGTSDIWTGKWREFQQIDFEARPHVPYSGWPISLQDLLSSYREVEREHDFGDFEAFERSEAYVRLQREIGGSGLDPSFHYWEREALRAAQSFREELESSPNITVVLGANATELVPDTAGQQIASLRCRSLEGRRITFAADHFVIATGGLEAPRLLLASRARDPRGVGNAHDLVGRFFMDHPKIKAGKLWPGHNFDKIPGKAESFPRPRFKVNFSLSREMQYQASLLNHTIQFSTPEATGFSKLNAAWKRRHIGGVIRSGLRLAASPSAMGEAVHQMRSTAPQPLKVTLMFEQAPNPDSRLSLSEERDDLGMPKLLVDWRLTLLDQRSFTQTIDLLTKALADSGVGRLDFDGSPPALEDTSDAMHPMGTTRMGATPATGVVDSDCKVFGVDNLFVASGSVFPTGHSYGPTLTIVALARRASARIVRDSDRVQADVSKTAT